MKNVTCMGNLWRMSERNWKRLLRDVASGTQHDMDNYGKPLGEVENVTDLSAEDARRMLEGNK